MSVKLIDGTEVVSGVAIALRNFFTEKEVPVIYKDKPIQGFVKPCFFIQLVSDSSQRIAKNSFMRNYIIDVRYHPADDNNAKETTCSQISNYVLDAVNTVIISDLPVKAYAMDCRVTDEVLHCITTYRFKVNETEQTLPKMESLDVKEGVK